MLQLLGSNSRNRRPAPFSSSRGGHFRPPESPQTQSESGDEDPDAGLAAEEDQFVDNEERSQQLAAAASGPRWVRLGKHRAGESWPDYQGHKFVTKSTCNSCLRDLIRPHSCPSQIRLDGFWLLLLTAVFELGRIL